MTLELDRSDPDVLQVRFVIEGQEPPGPVSVVGNFNEWQPGWDELVKDGDGTRSVTIELPYNEQLVFRYLAANDVWFDEPDAGMITEQGSVLYAVSPQLVDLDRARDVQNPEVRLPEPEAASDLERRAGAVGGSPAWGQT